MRSGARGGLDPAGLCGGSRGCLAAAQTHGVSLERGAGRRRLGKLFGENDMFFIYIISELFVCFLCINLFFWGIYISKLLFLLVFI